MRSRTRSPFLFFAVLGTAILVSAPSFSAEAVSPPALAPLPAPPSPPENPTTPEKVELGKMLFFDRRLSGDGTMNCATCHDPETGFADALPISLSYPTTRNWRNSPGLVNAAYRKTLFRDGRSASLEEQSLFPMMSPFEMNRNLDYLEEVLKTVPAYVEAFRSIFGGEITRQRAAMAVAAFERTLVSRDTPLDRHLHGERGALTAKQRAGLELFTGKAGCSACHNGPNLTDERFHNLGVPDDPKAKEDPRVLATARFVGKVSGLPAFRTLSEDPGRFLVTKDPADWKAFATSPLREVASTAPYMHNGALGTLEEVIDFFDRGGGGDPKKSPLLRPLGLSKEEKESLREFLATGLSGKMPKFRTPAVP
ncbi:MAG TPA: cytochrome c peroxidase [Candidatus Deferrimicrobiaceae bacterium]|nr:cytochrome c peroxidase [Candidatus Deferrimicrobiaceae bacterium]